MFNLDSNHGSVSLCSFKGRVGDFHQATSSSVSITGSSDPGCRYLDLTMKAAGKEQIAGILQGTRGENKCQVCDVIA